MGLQCTNCGLNLRLRTHLRTCIRVGESLRVRAHVSVCGCVHVRVCVCVCASTCLLLCACVWAHAYACVGLHVWGACVCVRVRVGVGVCVCARRLVCPPGRPAALLWCQVAPVSHKHTEQVSEVWLIRLTFRMLQWSTLHDTLVLGLCFNVVCSLSMV